MKKFKTIILLTAMCMTILVFATGFTYGLGRVNGYCESGDLNPLKKDRIRTDTYGATEQKLVATAELQYYVESSGKYVTQGSRTAVKNYGVSGNVADTGWYESTQGDELSIRNVYEGIIYNANGTVDFRQPGYVFE